MSDPLTTTPEMVFLACRSDKCSEPAISYSEHCWDHAPQEDYLVGLPGQLNSLRTRGESIALNLKKVIADGLDFSGLALDGSDFSQARFKHSSFVGARLNQINCIGAALNQCDFVGADLKQANFTRAVFSNCALTYADLSGAVFVEAFFKDVDLMGAVLLGVFLWNADLSGAKHLKRKNFRDPRDTSQHPKVRLSESDPAVASECYRMVKHYFYSCGLYEDASWAAYRERLMERRHFYKTRDLRYVPSLLMDLMSGYTEKPSRVILSSLTLVLVFAGLYYLLDAAAPGNSGAVPQRLSLGNALYFSFITFTTVGYGDMVPRPEFWYKCLACFEAFSGPFMSGLYIFTLTRRYAAG